jgi:ketosteroid isomerase-like protein
VRFVAALLSATVLAGCGGGPSDDQQVRQTLTDFVQATAHKDFKRMCDQLLAPRLVAQLQQIGLPCEQALQKGLGDVRDPHLTIGRVTVNGDSATAQIRTSAAGQAPSQDTIDLTKVDGRWRILSLGRP